MNLSRRHVRVAVSASACMAVLAVLVWSSNTFRPVSADAVPPPAGPALWADTGGVDPVAPRGPRFQTGLENLPTSMRDTEVPGSLAQDAAGNLVIRNDLRRIFDYFLALAGDESPAAIHARLAAYIGAHVGAKATGQALVILDQYGAYRQALPDLAKRYAGERLEQIKARFAALDNLRRTTFAPDVAQAFFGDEEAWDHYTVAKLEIQQNAALSLQQRNAALAELKKQLPDALRDSVTTAELLQNLDEAQQDWKRRGGTPEELHAARAALVGQDGADRLDAMDRANTAWDARMASYLDQRAQILVDPTLAETTRQSQVDALRARLFAGPEAVRARALETLHDAPPGAQ